MKTEFEPQDLEAIAQRVAEHLKPLLSNNAKNDKNTIFNVDGLADYLKTSKKWIYERTRFNEIPFFKVRGQLRFSEKEIDKWLNGFKVPSVTSTYTE